MALRVNMTGNATGFTQMLRTARTEVTAFSNAISSEINTSFSGAFKGAITGMLTFQGVAAVLRGVIGQITTLRNLSDQIGTNDIEGIQKWQQAFERVGGSAETMTRILGELQDKREAAMGSDIGSLKQREQLEAMGFTAGEINPNGGLDPLQFMQRAFNFSNASAENAAFFQSIFGPRSARFAGAGKYESEQAAPIDDETYQNLLKVAQATEHFEQSLAALTGKGLSVATWSVGADKLQTSMASAEKASNSLQQSINRIREKVLAGTATEFDKHWLTQAMEATMSVSNGKFDRWFHSSFYDHAVKSGQPGKQYGSAIGPQEPVVDPDVQAQKDAWKEEEDAAIQSLHRIQEEHMTIGDRLRQINLDLAQAHQNTLAIQGKLNSPTLGLSKTAFDNMTPIERDELRHKLTMQELSSQSNEAGLRNQTYQPPLAFNGTAMDKVGLYSASALTFNPLLGLNKTNELLSKIVTNTARPVSHPPHDPFRP